VFAEDRAVGVMSMTAMSVMMRETHVGGGEGKPYLRHDLGLAALRLVGHQHDHLLGAEGQVLRTAETADQLARWMVVARSPLAPTSSPPSMVTSIHPPRMSANDSSCDMNDMPLARSTGLAAGVHAVRIDEVCVFDDSPEADDAVLV